MEIKTYDKYCILTPLSPKLDLRESKRMFEQIKANSEMEIGLDLSFVSDCTIEFLDKLSQTPNVGIFNIQSDVFALFNFMNIDKLVPLFVSELDFKTNKRQLLNRKFKLI